MFRMLGAVSGISMTALLVAAFTIGGFDVDDPQLEDSIYWARGFAAEQPGVTGVLAAQCAATLAASPTRDGAVRMFQCVRRQAKARGYS
jgi:hypothetical protein